MIDADLFVAEVIRQGAAFFTGVPCSLLTPVIDAVRALEPGRYVVASSEGEAVSIASGAWLAGKVAVAFCQNSGLGNMLNPLSSLNEPFEIPVLLLITWRGKPAQFDEPQHRQMGLITQKLLALLEIESTILPKNTAASIDLVSHAFRSIRERHRPYGILIEPESFQSRVFGDKCQLTSDDSLPSREEAIKTVLASISETAIVIATTGKTGRELFALADRPNHFYCMGSMGYASSLGYGIALSGDRQVYVLDGDGAALMHLGNFTSIGSQARLSYVHLVLDNESYDSTGSQPTASASVDFAAVALGAGYEHAISCSSCFELSTALKMGPAERPRLIHMRIRPGSMEALGRPAMEPREMARRFRRFLSSGSG